MDSQTNSSQDTHTAIPSIRLRIMLTVVLSGLAACHLGDGPPAGRFTAGAYPLTIDCDVDRKETQPAGEVTQSKKTERFTLSEQTRAGLLGPKQEWIRVSDIDGVLDEAPAQKLWVLVREGADELTERRIHHTLWDGQTINEYTHIEVTDSFIKLKNSVGYPHDKQGRERDILVISRIDGSLVERWTIASPDGDANYEDKGECYLPGQKPKPKAQPPKPDPKVDEALLEAEAVKPLSIAEGEMAHADESEIPTPKVSTPGKQNIKDDDTPAKGAGKLESKSESGK